ncbi:TVP38/TMEM64 family protein [Bacillus sp. T3]|uniref:TVP38/TMEM64 family protein n=1 Tax=Bacillus sp. T3 TaxID=467262 RepID=UPI00298247AB|nr:VTT domain-containing protein [Bacillus sp. T3]
MNQQVVELLQNYKPYAFVISIVINIIISIFGFVPSLFLTAANLVVFGFWKGMLVSFVGEGIGAVVAFILYRKGLRRVSETKTFHRPIVKRLLEVEGSQAFMLVLSLRLLPFVPSGVITFLSAIGKMTIWIFAISSTIGKLPALLFEAYAANQVVQSTWQGEVVITIVAVILLISVFKSLNRKKSKDFI